MNHMIADVPASLQVNQSSLEESQQMLSKLKKLRPEWELLQKLSKDIPVTEAQIQQIQEKLNSYQQKINQVTPFFPKEIRIILHKAVTRITCPKSTRQNLEKSLIYWVLHSQIKSRIASAVQRSCRRRKKPLRYNF